MVVCVYAESTLVSLSSRNPHNCGGGNLIKIYANQCNITAAKVQCKVKCDGSFPNKFTSKWETMYFVEDLALLGTVKCFYLNECINQREFKYDCMLYVAFKTFNIPVLYSSNISLPFQYQTTINMYNVFDYHSNKDQKPTNYWSFGCFSKVAENFEQM